MFEIIKKHKLKFGAAIIIIIVVVAGYMYFTKPSPSEKLVDSDEQQEKQPENPQPHRISDDALNTTVVDRANIEAVGKHDYSATQP